MNEEELKAIWKKNDNPTIDIYNFTEVKEKTMQLQQKIKKRMRFDTVALIFSSILAIGLGVFVPKLSWLILLIAFVCFRYWMEVSKYRTFDGNFQKCGNVKDFLQMKQENSKRYQRFDKILACLLPTFTLILAYFTMMPLELIWERWIIIVSGLIVIQIVMVFIFKYLYHLINFSMLDETEELLRQLDEIQ